MDLPVTVTEGQQAHTDTEQAELYANLQALDVALINLKNAGMMSKAQFAEVVVNETRAILGAVASSIHALKNENTRLRADLDHIKKHGFGG